MWSSEFMHRYVRHLILLVLMAALAGCGFQLRGSYELPYKSVFVSAAATSQVASNIRRELTGTPTK